MEPDVSSKLSLGQIRKRFWSVHSVDDYFNVALFSVYPILIDEVNSVHTRLVAAFILFDLYKHAPFQMNPFRQPLLAISGGRDVPEEFAVLSAQVSQNGKDGMRCIRYLLRMGDERFSELESMSTSDLVLAAEKESKDNPSENIGYSPDFRDYDGVGGNNDAGQGMSGSAKNSGHESTAFALSLLTAAKERTLSIRERRSVLPTLSPDSFNPTLLEIIGPSDLPSLTSANPEVAYTFLVSLFAHTKEGEIQVPNGKPLDPSSTIQGYLEALTSCPPSLASFDVVGRLLHQPDSGEGGGTAVTLGDLVKKSVLGGFLENGYKVAEGLKSEDGFDHSEDRARTVKLITMFLRSLISSNVIELSSSEEVTGMTHFAMSHPELRDANELYAMIMEQTGNM